uniref:HTH CENPB-type domain-containing protein n=1 Tax=Hucho hucho TaxID=62062 RepID=A0A4W5MFY0_9TELE
MSLNGRRRNERGHGKKGTTKRRQYSREALETAVEKVKAGMSLREASRESGIPHTTLQDHKKNKYAFAPHPNLAITTEEEHSLISYVLWMADHAFPISRTVVKALAVAIIKESGRSTVVNLERGLSDNWWSRFRARHPELSARVPDPLNRARVHGATPAAIKGFFDVYEPIFVSHGLEHKPHLIFNCDETGFADKLKSREKVLCQKGIYQQQQHTTREHVTVHCCVSAAGESIPPFIIFHKCLPSTAYALEGPPKALYGVSPKGYMDAELFLKWLVFFVKHAPKERPLVLVVDHHKTHVSREVVKFCRENQVEVVCLPANTTHVLQPLDISVFGPLKTVLSRNAARLGLVQGDLVIGKKHFSARLREAYPQAVTKKNIMAGFKKAGIFPLNREAFDSSQLVKLEPTTPNPKAATSEATSGTPDPKAAEAPTTPATPTTPAATPFLVPGGCCPTCGQRAPPTNPLVAAGLVSPDLANILVPPVFQTSNRQKGKRQLLLPARVITSDEYNKLLHQQEAEEKEKQERKREELQRTREKREPGKNTRVKRKWQVDVSELDGEVSEHCAPVSEDDVCLQPQLPWAFSFPSFDSLL